MDETTEKEKSFLVERQIVELIDKIELKEKDIKERIELCSTIQKLFTEAGYSHCLVQPYGSTINGCGFQCCDLDLHVSFGMSPSPSVCQAATLLSSSPLLTKVSAVPRARVPIVRAVDIKTGVSLDLSFNCQASLWNTEFIRSCCSYDHRVRPLIMLVRFWAKQKKLTGRQESQVRLCNYSLTMLVIGYLQQLPEPVLPSLKRVIQQSGQPISWHSLGQLPTIKQKNSFSLLQLLAGFFSHYHNFPFNQQTVSVYHGQVRPKTDMQRDLQQILKPAGEQPLIGQGSPRSIQNDKPMCVQDPFEPWFNMTRVVTDQGLAVFQFQLYQAALVSKTFLSPDKQTDLGPLLISGPYMGSTVFKDMQKILQSGRQQPLQGCPSSIQSIWSLFMQNSFKPREVTGQSLGLLNCQLPQASLQAKTFPSKFEQISKGPSSREQKNSFSQIHMDNLRHLQQYSQSEMLEPSIFLHSQNMPLWWLKWRGIHEARELRFSYNRIYAIVNNVY